MCEKYLVIKKNDDYKSSKPLDDDSFEKLKQAALVLESFNTLAFLSSNYEKAKENFLGYDFTQFN